MRAYVRHACDTAGLSPTALARQAGLAPSTLNRFLNDDPPPSLLGQATLAKVGAAAGIEAFAVFQPGTASLTADRGPEGSAVDLSEDSAIFVMESAGVQPLPKGGATASEVSHPAQSFLHALSGAGRHVTLWRMRGGALNLAGLLDGDFVVVDLNGRAASGDLVLAQLYDWSAGTARTVFRLFEPPYLVAASTDPVYRRPDIAGERAVIKGTILMSFRIQDAQLSAIIPV